MTSAYVSKNRHWQAFFTALLLASIVFLPFVIADKGYFLYYGDYNVQQIPFYQLAHDAVRSGAIHWNWFTDLGANFIGSYSFYLLMSPFFWITLLFPTAAVPFLMAPLLALKTACAALTSYFFIARFVKDKRYAVIGSLLYAFSGYMVFNIFFNHFHEVAVFFPLLLIALEELMQNNRRGFFAIAIAVNALVNYWFFIGSAVFTAIYFFVRLLSKGWKISFKKLLWVGFEIALGMICSMFIFLPSVLAIMGNPRTTSNNILNGWNFWLYWNVQRQPAIFSSMFFPPDLPSRPNFFSEHDAKWASMSAWLPLFSMSGVIAYVSSVKKSWLTKLLMISLLMAMIPGLNSAFILFNHSYYARWFYMPILLMCVATAIALENPRVNYMRGWRWTLGITVFITLMLAFTVSGSGENKKIGLLLYPERFWAWVAVALLGLTMAFILYKYRRERHYFKMAMLGLSFICCSYSIATIAMGKSHSDNRDFLIDTAINGRYDLSLPDSGFYRVDVFEGMDNLAMFWNLPNIQAFHSIIPVSLMEFYPLVGVKRDVSSKPETRYWELRALFSVKWLFIAENNGQQYPMPGFEYYDNQLGFNIYENLNYIPMGFTYDYFIDMNDFNEMPRELRGRLLLKAICLDDDALDRNADLLKWLDLDSQRDLDESKIRIDAENRRANSAHEFTIDNDGFSASIYLERENLVFFSVPYDDGWTAHVNGEPAIIEKANIGFMAVRVPAGNSEIRFVYRAPGLNIGIILSLAGTMLLVLYMAVFFVKRKRGGIHRDIDKDIYASMNRRIPLPPDERFIPSGLEGYVMLTQYSVFEPSAINDTLPALGCSPVISADAGAEIDMPDNSTAPAAEDTPAGGDRASQNSENPSGN